MKITIKKTLQGLLLVPILALGFSVVTPALVPAANAVFDGGVADGSKSAQGKDQEGDASCLFDTGDCEGDGIFKTITNVLLFIIGAISVIMLIIGGIRYTVSGGDQGAVTSAKNTILYAVVGIVVAILAYAIVNFVVGSFAGDS